jgi:hypothetical protein
MELKKYLDPLNAEWLFMRGWSKIIGQVLNEDKVGVYFRM